VFFFLSNAYSTSFNLLNIRQRHRRKSTRKSPVISTRRPSKKRSRNEAFSLSSSRRSSISSATSSSKVIGGSSDRNRRNKQNSSKKCLTDPIEEGNENDFVVRNEANGNTNVESTIDDSVDCDTITKMVPTGSPTTLNESYLHEMERKISEAEASTKDVFDTNKLGGNQTLDDLNEKVNDETNNDGNKLVRSTDDYVNLQLDSSRKQDDNNGTIDILAYHQGREEFDFRIPRGAIENHKPLVAAVIIDIPLCHTSDTDSIQHHDFYRETIQWDLSNLTMPNPVVFATTIGEQFGLTYPMIWDLAYNIQTQLQNFVHENCGYTSPTIVDPESLASINDTGNRKGVVTVPQLYGEVTGFLQQGGICIPTIPRSKAPPTENRRTTQREDSSASTGRSISGSQRSASNGANHRQQTSHGNKSRVKIEPSTLGINCRKRVPKLPISEFPREFSNGRDMNFGFDVDYQTLFTAEGSFLVTTDNDATTKNPTETTTTTTSTSTTTQREQQSSPHIEDGSVDFCNVCKTVGDLLCCDFCPRAFHCQCISNDAIPESMNDESKWECPCCIQERNGLPGDNITHTPIFDTLISMYNVDDEDTAMVQQVTVLSVLYEMLRMLMDYDFGDVFRSPVNYREIPTYKTIVKNPMDLGTISKNLGKGRYECKSLEGVVLAVLKDIELVWHNCFIFNIEGSAVYRMANIHKRRAHSIRQRSFDHLISDRVKKELANYITSLELERDNHRRLDAIAIQARRTLSTIPTTTSTTAPAIQQPRHKISSPSRTNAKSRPIAILDAESGRIMRVYSSMQAASNAVNIITNLNRYECEWETNEIDSLNKMRKVILMCNVNPKLRLFGYRWLCLDALRNRRVKFANPKSKVIEPSLDEDGDNVTIHDKSVKEELIELVSDGKSFLFYSIAEALSFPALPGNVAEVEGHIEKLVSGADFETIDGNMWKRSDLEDLQSYGIEYVKEDTICGDSIILCGFMHIVAAHKDWCLTLDSSITSTEESRTLDVFSRSYVDQDCKVDGIQWRRLQPRSVDDDNKVLEQSMNGCDTTINNITASVSGIQQETSSTDTHTTDNSNSSRVYDLETVPSPKKQQLLLPNGKVSDMNNLRVTPLKCNGLIELETKTPSNNSKKTSVNDNGVILEQDNYEFDAV
jgi:Bromodomain